MKPSNDKNVYKYKTLVTFFLKFINEKVYLTSYKNLNIVCTSKQNIMYVKTTEYITFCSKEVFCASTIHSTFKIHFKLDLINAIVETIILQYAKRYYALHVEIIMK